jgi:hypothetical protein
MSLCRRQSYLKLRLILNGCAARIGSSLCKNCFGRSDRIIMCALRLRKGEIRGRYVILFFTLQRGAVCDKPVGLSMCRRVWPCQENCYTRGKGDD